MLRAYNHPGGLFRQVLTRDMQGVQHAIQRARQAPAARVHARCRGRPGAQRQRGDDAQRRELPTVRAARATAAAEPVRAGCLQAWLGACRARLLCMHGNGAPRPAAARVALHLGAVHMTECRAARALDKAGAVLGGGAVYDRRPVAQESRTRTAPAWRAAPSTARRTRRCR